MATIEERLVSLELQLELKCSSMVALSEKLDRIHEDILKSRARQEQRQIFYNWAIKLLWIFIPLAMWVVGGNFRDVSGFFKTR